MDVARCQYESLHDVGSGDDGANQLRHWKLATAVTPITTTDYTKFLTPRVKRKKREKITTGFIEQSDDEVTRGGEQTTRKTTNDETTRSPLENIEDDEDVDFSEATPNMSLDFFTLEQKLALARNYYHDASKESEDGMISWDESEQIIKKIWSKWSQTDITNLLSDADEDGDLLLIFVLNIMKKKI
ncbi:unnamed protein product [Rotaria sp. Silwood2]|nr:unnamed protein product [Rotaria sp. Silwood2]